MNFTKREGISVPQAEITIRYGEPKGLKGYVLRAMQKYAPSLKAIRDIVCSVTAQPEDLNNWGENSFMETEIQEKINQSLWNEIYDIVERFYTMLGTSEKKDSFEDEINRFFYKNGVGWEFRKGKITSRGDEIYENIVCQTELELGEKGLQTSQNEIKEAIQDLSRRPTPDVTGAIQHAGAALECVSRDIAEEPNKTLGDLAKIMSSRNIIPKPLDEVIGKIWGFSSEKGRHVREGGEASYEEAELVVHLVASICSYLIKKKDSKPQEEFVPSFS